MMDVAFMRAAAPRLLLAVAMAVALSAGGASAQTIPDPSKKTEQVDPKAPAAPTNKMESPEVPRPPSAQDPAKAVPGTPHPPEQPYPAKAKDK
jgi:hypothetical protein